MTIAQDVAHVAAADPDRLALVEPQTGRTATFGELDARSSALAGAFARLGLRPGDRVAILSKNRNEYLEVYLACAKSGCVAYGANWRLAPEALAASLRSCRPSLAIVEDRFASLAATLQRVIDVPAWAIFGADSDGSYDDLVQRGVGRFTRASPAPARPLMILATGGTTGDSKGAVHSHGSVRTAMANNAIAERIVPADRYLLLGQAYHSAVVLALNYLCHGCAVVVIDFDPRLALEVIDAWDVTAFLTFPTMLTYMLEHGTSARFRLASLRNIQYGGGHFAETTIRAMLDTFPCGLLQCYGTTESIGIAFLSPEDHRRAQRAEPALLRSCGRPAFLTDVRLAALDGDRVGEILVRSPSNMLGYWGDESRRRAWLATGDLGRLDDRGYLHIVGRSKEVIISGGENIYAAQVEGALCAHPAILEAAVVGVPDAAWGEAVRAVVVLRPGRTASADELRAWVGAQLASYQKPRDIRFVAELPRTPTGKVLKRELL